MELVFKIVLHSHTPPSVIKVKDSQLTYRLFILEGQV